MAQRQSRQPAIDRAVDKLQTRPVARLGETEDSADFLSQHDEDRQLSRAVMLVSQPVLSSIWDNPDDAQYEQICIRTGNGRVCWGAASTRAGT